MWAGMNKNTVTQKTIAMFATFDFHSIFLHNLFLRILEIVRQYSHISHLYMCQISKESNKSSPSYDLNKSHGSLQQFLCRLFSV